MYIVPQIKRTCNAMYFKKAIRLDTNYVCTLVLVLLQIIGLFTPKVNGNSLNCSSVRQLFEIRQLNITDVPKLPLSGKSSHYSSCSPT